MAKTAGLAVVGERGEEATKDADKDEHGDDDTGTDTDTDDDSPRTQLGTGRPKCCGKCTQSDLHVHTQVARCLRAS